MLEPENTDLEKFLKHDKTQKIMAERVRFELTEPFRVRRFSRPVP